MKIYASTNRKCRRTYATRWIKADNDVDTTFGDPNDIMLPNDVEKAFTAIVDKLHEYSYEDFVDTLDDIIDDRKIHVLLSKGFGNGDLANVHMSSSSVALPVQSLLPSQSEIGLDNSLKFPLSMDCSIYFNSPVTVVAPILTYRKTFIIDGHHRWSQIYMLNPNATVSALNFDYNIESPFIALRNFQRATIAVATGDIQMQYSNFDNVYNMGKNEIESYIDQNIQDICWQSLANNNVCDNRDTAIKYLTHNALLLKNNIDH